MTSIAEQGFAADGVEEEDYWSFNNVHKGSLEVYRDSGRNLYSGNIEDLLSVEDT